jgi:hypothetical protein
VENQEAVHPSALVRGLPDVIERQAGVFLPSYVMAAHLVGRLVLLPVDDLLRMEQMAVRSRTHMTDQLRFAIREQSTPVMFSDGFYPPDWMPCSRQYRSQ